MTCDWRIRVSTAFLLVSVGRMTAYEDWCDRTPLTHLHQYNQTNQKWQAIASTGKITFNSRTPKCSPSYPYTWTSQEGNRVQAPTQQLEQGRRPGLRQVMDVAPQIQNIEQYSPSEEHRLLTCPEWSGYLQPFFTLVFSDPPAHIRWPNSPLTLSFSILSLLRTTHILPFKTPAVLNRQATSFLFLPVTSLPLTHATWFVPVFSYTSSHPTDHCHLFSFASNFHTSSTQVYSIITPTVFPVLPLYITVLSPAQVATTT